MTRDHIDFEWAISFVLSHEGGYSNHPDDPGGETNFGISKRAYPLENIRSMTRERAAMIFKRDYWDRLPNVGRRLKFLLFDFGVNAGVGRSVRTLQKAINTKDDGIFGPASHAALDRSKNALHEFCVIRQLYYCSLPTFKTFGKGWTRRTFDAYRYATEVKE